VGFVHLRGCAATANLIVSAEPSTIARLNCERAAVDGGESGIRTLGPPLDSASCRIHIARIAVDARVAVAPCTGLHRREFGPLGATLDRRIARLCQRSVDSSGSSFGCSWRPAPVTTCRISTRTTGNTLLCSASFLWISSRAICLVHNDDSSRRGRSFTKQSSRLIGSGCRQVARRCRLPRYNRTWASSTPSIGSPPSSA